MTRPTAPTAAHRENAASPRPADTVQLVELAFDLLRVDLPVAGTRHSRKIWNHVDGSAISAEQLERLSRNGIRVGVGAAKSWPAIRTILTACDAELRQEQLFGQRNLPLVLELGAIEESESIFAFSADRRLQGRTFSAGKKLMQIDYAIRSELGGTFDLQIRFEVSRDLGTLTWERSGGVLRQVPEVDRHVFEELTTAVALNPGAFLVVGPSEEADREYLVGSRFLLVRREGRTHETLYFITPSAYQRQGASSAAR
ncbi:MAG: hypothetical protein HY763_07595 [Planctomycetes bacterium]|nr:hypothetical protein [Planctomycetota bacterium]